ncbi:hypothetical protein CUS77_14485 [Enterococcus faecium]|nr:hypothetical protein CUS77_14485 [Enterococcus faecium]
MVPNGRQTSQNEKVRKPELTAIKAKFKKYGVPTEAAYKVASNCIAAIILLLSFGLKTQVVNEEPTESR